MGVLSAEAEYPRGARIIARTDRGLEAGEVLCEADEYAMEFLNDPAGGQILREMTPEDAHELERIRAQAKDEIAVCQHCVDKLQLEMQLVGVEHIFGGERVVVYYLAESRVDFRDLVRMLASESGRLSASSDIAWRKYDIAIIYQMEIIITMQIIP